MPHTFTHFHRVQWKPIIILRGIFMNSKSKCARTHTRARVKMMGWARSTHDYTKHHRRTLSRIATRRDRRAFSYNITNPQPESHMGIGGINRGSFASCSPIRLMSCCFLRSGAFFVGQPSRSRSSVNQYWLSGGNKITNVFDSIGRQRPARVSISTDLGASRRCCYFTY